MSFFPALHLDAPVLDVDIKRAEILVDIAGLDSDVVWNKKKWGTYVPPGLERHESICFSNIAKVYQKAQLAFDLDMSTVIPVRPEHYAYLMNVPTAPKSRINRVIEHAEVAIRPIISAHVNALAQLTGTQPAMPDVTFFSDAAKHYYSVEEVYASFIESFATRRNQGADRAVRVENDFCRGIISESMCIVTLPETEGRWYSLSYQQLLMLRDAAMMRRNGHITAKVLYPSDFLLEESLNRSFKWQELCIERFGNEGYELAKSVESMAKAYLSRIGGDILSGPSDSFQSMLEKVAEKERTLRSLDKESFPLYATLAWHYYVSVLQPLQSVAQVCEVFGLQKFSGHPVIDPRVASAKSRLVAQAPDPTSPDIALHMRAVFSDMFTRAYIARHKEWPKMEFLRPGTELQRLYEGKTLALQRAAYDLRDWDHVNFLKTFDFDEYDNYLELMDDKSISHLLTEKHASWDDIPVSTQKRLLLELLRRLSVDTHWIIKAIEDDQIPIQWLICSLYPKEREFKLAARAFTMMVFEMRAFFTVHEANLADTILRYFPSITMVDSKLDIHRRFLSMTRPIDSPDLVRLLLELDLSSWNLMWRGLIVEGIGQQINKLMGLKRVYTTVHKFFERCCMMMRVAGCRPDQVEKLWPPESDLIHYDHAGGLEGIAQKLWSICTVAMIQLALHNLNISYTITDQGDNIVLIVTEARDWSQSLRSQLDTLAGVVLKQCSETATSVHQELKPEECLVSTIALTYSKVIYVNGVDYPTAIKALSRVYPAASVDFPSISSYIASIFSSCYTAAETVKTPERCYWIALLHGSLFLTRASQQSGPYVRAVQNRPQMFSFEGIRLQLLWPSELGGYPIIGPYSFFYKGGSDPLSKSVASLKMLQRYSPDARIIIGAMQSNSLYDPSPKLLSLIQDPYGLPIEKPKTPGDSVAEETLEVMKGITRNREIREVLTFATEAYETQLVDALGTMKPFNPLIAHKMFEASALGTVNNLKKMGVKTQTMQALARSDPESEIIGKMVSAGIREIDCLWKLIIRFSRETGMIDSVYQEVKTARARWAPCGQTPAGLTSYLPIDFEFVWNPKGPVVGILAEYCTYGMDAFYTRGPMRPYLGTATRSKVSDHGYKIHGHSYASSALRALQVVLAWCEPTADTLQLIDYLAYMRCGRPLSVHAESLIGIYGGNSNHRFDAYLGSASACLMGQSAFAHYVTLYTDKAGYLSGSVQDYPIMWQEFMCLAVGLCSYRWSRAPDAHYGRLVVRIGHESLETLPDERLTFSDYVLPPQFPTINKLIQSDSIYIRQTGGPIWSSCITLHTQEAEPYEFSALVSVLTKVVGGRQAVQGVVDNLTEAKVVALGITELRGMGLQVFFQAAGCALLDIVQGIVHSPKYSSRFNANVNFLVQRYGLILISLVMPYISHPDLANDPIVVRLNLGPSPRYDRRFSSERLLLAELSTTMIRLYHDRTSPYYTYMMAVFGSDPLSGTEQAVIRMLRRKAALAMITGLVSHEEATFIIGSPIRRLSMLTIRDAEARLEEFQSILLSYESYRRGSIPLTLEAASIPMAVANASAGCKIHATRASAEEIVRRYRYRSSPQVLRAYRQHLPRTPISKVNLRSIAGFSPDHVETEVERLKDLFNHAYGNTLSFGSGAMIIWLPLSELFTGHDVVIIGSGLGACAAAAIMGGAKSVLGHDLRVDFPPGVPLGEYIPPLVRLYGGRSKYLQSEETLSTDGDWFSAAVSRRLCTKYNYPYLLVIDISSSDGFSHRALRPLMAHDFPYPVLFRIVAIPREHENVCGIIARTSDLLGVWEGHRTGVRVERVYHFRIRKPFWSPIIHPYNVFRVPKLPRGGGRQTVDQIAAFVLAPLGGLTGRTLKDSIQAALITFEGMVTDQKTRPTYSEWTSTLHAALACEILLTSSRDEFEAFVTQNRPGSVYQFACVQSIHVLITQQLLFFLANTVARIPPYLGRVITHQVTFS